MDDLKKYKFENLYTNNEYVVDNYPFFINSDGYMLL